MQCWGNKQGTRRRTFLLSRNSLTCTLLAWTLRIKRRIRPLSHNQRLLRHSIHITEFGEYRPCIAAKSGKYRPGNERGR